MSRLQEKDEMRREGEGAEKEKKKSKTLTGPEGRGGEDTTLINSTLQKLGINEAL